MISNVSNSRRYSAMSNGKSQSLSTFLRQRYNYDTVTICNLNMTEKIYILNVPVLQTLKITKLTEYTTLLFTEHISLAEYHYHMR